MHTHAPKKGGGGSRCARVCVCVCVGVCVFPTSCLLMSSLAGNCSDRPICEQGYASPEGCVCMYMSMFV